MMTARRYTVRSARQGAAPPLAAHVLRDEALAVHAAAGGDATIFDDATGLPADGLEEMAAPPPAPAHDVNAWLAEQHAAALAHREQCIARVAALRAEIATVEAQVEQLNQIIHRVGSERNSVRMRTLAHLTTSPRCTIRALAQAVYGRDDKRACLRARLTIYALKAAGRVRNVGRGQWEVV